MKLISRIHRFIPRDLMVELYSICKDRTIANNNRKADMMAVALKKHKVDYKELGPGTNRYVIKVDGYVFKIAMDNDGINDNNIEFSMSDELQPYVAKTYECNGLIVVAEYVTVITKEEFMNSRDGIREILSILSDDYIFGDVGYITKNFLNWGYRYSGELVILDYGYIYRVKGHEVQCNKVMTNGERCGKFLEYDTNFDNLVCPHCRTKYTYDEIRRRINLQSEREEIEQTLNEAYVMESDTMEVATITSKNKPNEKIESEDLTMKDDFTREEINDMYEDALAHVFDKTGNSVNNNTDGYLDYLDDLDEDDWDDDIIPYSDDDDDGIMNDQFLLMDFCGTKVLFTPERVESTDVPEGMSKYELRESFYGSKEICEINKHVFIDFFGTILSKYELIVGNVEPDEYEITDIVITPKDYCGYNRESSSEEWMNDPEDNDIPEDDDSEDSMYEMARNLSCDPDNYPNMTIVGGYDDSEEDDIPDDLDDDEEDDIPDDLDDDEEDESDDDTITEALEDDDADEEDDDDESDESDEDNESTMQLFQSVINSFSDNTITEALEDDDDSDEDDEDDDDDIPDDLGDEDDSDESDITITNAVTETECDDTEDEDDEDCDDECVTEEEEEADEVAEEIFDELEESIVDSEPIEIEPKPCSSSTQWIEPVADEKTEMLRAQLMADMDEEDDIRRKKNKNYKKERDRH